MDLRYPNGRFEPIQHQVSPQERSQRIEEFKAIPSDLEKAIADMSSEELDTPSREGGWTARQLAHHIPDSHLNGYIRMKWALTEDSPVIKPYDQDRWSVLKDVQDTPIRVSLALLSSLHERWAILMNSMTDEDFRKTLQHPESGTMNLDNILALYVWHGKHHIAQIRALRNP